MNLIPSLPAFSFRLPGLIGLIIVLMSSCTAKRFIPEDQQLYTGAIITVDSVEIIEKGKRLRREMKREIGPKPNFSLFGIRPRLWLYYIVKDTADKGLKGWVKYTLGDPPVYLSSVPIRANKTNLREWLENKSFFEATVDHQLTDSGKTTGIEYLVHIHPPYIVNTITYLPTARPADTVVQAMLNDSSSFLMEGCPYSLNRLRQERVRMDDSLKLNGYIYFSSEFLHFKLDTSEPARNTDLYLNIKREAPDKAMIPYRIEDVVVHSGYNLVHDSLRPKFDTVDVEGYKFLFYDSTFRAKPIIRALAIAPGDLYNRELRNTTISRLTSMGAFRYVDIKFVATDTTSNEGKLIAHVYLSPMLQHSLRSELKFETKSNNFTGPGLDLSYRNRNLLRGAELLVVNVGLGYEAQFSRLNSGLNSYEVGFQTDLYVPHSISIFKGDKNVGTTMPRTHFGAGARMLSRIDYFSMYAVTGRYGYEWSPHRYIREELSPVTISFVNVHRTTARFEDILSDNPILRRSFEKQFIFGPEFRIVYNNQPDEKPVNLYVGFTIGESGFLPSLFNSQIAGVPVSQFIRSDIDLRQYFKVGNESKIATRIFAGAGYPYGGTVIMPYMKQYFAGGANSIRAFPARTVGPGSYAPPDSTYSVLFLDQSGDIKLEANIEYRFPISGIFKGAIFLDAGNVWLMNTDPNRPGGKFSFGKIRQELAAGYGFGLRIDLTFFVLRFDLAKPWLRPYNDSETPLPHQATGLLRDMVLNIAIGYPF